MSETRASAFEPGVLVGDRYRLGARLGAGGVGQIFEAVDERLERLVAVKVVRTPELADRATLARLEREARAAARVRHPNIVDVTDFGLTREGYPFIVMERLDGETLEQRIEAAAPLPVSLAIDLHLQLLDALEAAHAAGVLHRDVKPANVLVASLPSGAPIVTLLDFGLAALAEGAGASKLTDGGIVLGSPAYLAPERLLGRDADARSDLYSVGVSLFESLTGRRPFEAPSPLVLRGRVLSGEAPSVLSLRADLPPELAAVVTRAMAREPGNRFATAAQMRDALRGLGRAGEATLAPGARVVPSVPATHTPAPSTSAPLAPEPQRARSRWAMAAVALVALVGLAAWAASLGHETTAAAAPPGASAAVPRAPAIAVPSRESSVPVSIAPIADRSARSGGPARGQTSEPTIASAPPPATSLVPRDTPRAATTARTTRRPPSAETLAPTLEAEAVEVEAPTTPAPAPTVTAPVIDRPIEPVW